MFQSSISNMVSKDDLKVKFPVPISNLKKIRQNRNIYVTTIFDISIE